MDSTFQCSQGHIWSVPPEALEGCCPVCGEAIARGQATATGPGMTTPFSGAVSGATTAGPTRLPASAEVDGYEVLGVLGKGGMGTVYQARHRESQRLVALKMLHDVLLDDPQQRARFLGEAKAATRLEHPHVVRCLEVGEQGGRPYLVMELLTGGTLGQQLGRQPQPPRRAAELAETLARAVQVAHEAGIVHRDLKPDNVLLTAEGQPKVADFGLAKRLDADTVHTQTGVVLGTPSYMAPEQAAGRVHEVGPATDVWALGAILYELLTCRPPFQGANKMEVLDRVRTQDPAPLGRLQPGVPRDLETICLKCLHKDPHKRYPGAGNLADDLRRFLEDRPIRARRVGLVERAAKWRRRHPVAATLLAVAALGLLAGAAVNLWYWDTYRRVRIRHYAGYVLRRGLPEGIGLLTEDQLRRREFSYRFTVRGGRVEQVEIVNGHDRLTERLGGQAVLARPAQEADLPLPGDCRYVFRQDPNGNLLEETAYDRHGNVVWALHYTRHGDTSSTAHYTDARGFPRARTGSGAAYVEFLWSEEGFLREVHYLSRSGGRHPNDEYVFGEAYERDARGLAVRTTFLGADYRPVVNRVRKYAVARTRYDAHGNEVEQAYEDADGHPATSKDGYALRRSRPDAVGNVVELSYFGPDGRPTLNTDHVARMTARYDEWGNEVERHYFGVDGQPCPHWEGNAGWKARYDERGNRVEQEYFGPKGELVIHRDGLARFEVRYNDRDDWVEQAYFGTQGEPVLHKDGNHIVRNRYDDRGRVIERSYFDTAGKPTLYKDGFARFTVVYDSHGNIVEQAYFGVDGKPTLHKDGNHRVTYGYDDRGNRVELAYFDTEGNPTLYQGNCARVTDEYDDLGRLVKESCFGTDGRLVVTRDGFASMTVRHDEYGNPIERSYFGTDGRPTLHKDGNAGCQVRYDDQGNPVEWTFLGTDGRPTLNKDGVARWVARYDDRGNKVEMSYFGPDGQPCLHAEGNHRVTTRYDSRGHAEEWNYFGLAGERVRITNGYARFTSRRDEHGNEVERWYYGVDGRLTLHPDGNAGWKARYDDRGNQIAFTFHGTDRRPVHTKKGYASYTSRFDERGNPVETSYFGPEGEPVLHADGNHKVTLRFDERGNRTAESYFGPDGKPVRIRTGYARSQALVDEQGRPREQAYFGPDGRPCLHADGNHKVVITHDARGNRTSEAYYDVEGKPVAIKGGYARFDAVFDARGNRVEVAFFDAKGDPTLNAEGHARSEARYDERGRQIGMAYFGVDGQPAPYRGERIVRWEARYDDRGNERERTFYSADGRPALASLGYARKTASYDRLGRLTEQNSYRPDGTPILRITFDAEGPLEQTWFDPTGSPLPTRTVVVRVLPGSVGEKLGFQPGDILESYDGKPVRGVFRFIRGRRAEAEEGTPRPLRLLRKGQPITLELPPGSLGVELRDVPAGPPETAPAEPSR